MARKAKAPQVPEAPASEATVPCGCPQKDSGRHMGFCPNAKPGQTGSAAVDPPGAMTVGPASEATVLTEAQAQAVKAKAPQTQAPEAATVKPPKAKAQRAVVPSTSEGTVTQKLDTQAAMLAAISQAALPGHVAGHNCAACNSLRKTLRAPFEAPPVAPQAAPEAPQAPEAPKAKAKAPRAPQAPPSAPQAPRPDAGRPGNLAALGILEAGLAVLRSAPYPLTVKETYDGMQAAGWLHTGTGLTPWETLGSKLNTNAKAGKHGLVKVGTAFAVAGTQAATVARPASVPPTQAARRDTTSHRPVKAATVPSASTATAVPPSGVVPPVRRGDAKALLTDARDGLVRRLAADRAALDALTLDLDRVNAALSGMAEPTDDELMGFGPAVDPAEAARTEALALYGECLAEKDPAKGQAALAVLTEAGIPAEARAIADQAKAAYRAA